MIILSSYNGCNKVYNEIDFKYNNGILYGGDIMRFNSLVDALLGEFDANNNATYEQLKVTPKMIQQIRNHQILPGKGFIERLSRLTDNSEILQLFKQKSEEFEVPKQLGSKPSVLKILIGVITVGIISGLFTGFGYQPLWLFVLVLIIGLLIVLPIFFNEYWIIGKFEIIGTFFDKNEIKKVLQLLNLKKKYVKSVKYSDVSKAELIYKPKKRMSPFDFTGDYFYMIFDMSTGEKQALNLEKMDSSRLESFVFFLSSKNMIVEDQSGVLEALGHHENLFEHFANVGE